MLCAQITKSLNPFWPVGSWISIKHGGFGGSYLTCSNQKCELVIGACRQLSKEDGKALIECQVIQLPVGVEYNLSVF